MALFLCLIFQKLRPRKKGLSISFLLSLLSATRLNTKHRSAGSSQGQSIRQNVPQAALTANRLICKKTLAGCDSYLNFSRYPPNFSTQYLWYAYV